MARRLVNQDADPSAEEGSVSAPVPMQWSDSLHDPAWDGFVASHPAGHHIQSALWSELKSRSGWQTARLVITRGGDIVGGAQILYRRLAWRVNAGYLPKGPLLPPGEESLLPEVLDEIGVHARHLHLRHLTIQPVDGGVGRVAPVRRYLPSSIEVAPTATVLVDVGQPLEEVLAAMSPRTRYNIRLSSRKGVTVREGGKKDLEDYYRMYLQTAHRQGFEPTPPSYFRHMWEVLAPRRNVRLTLAEYDGRPLSGQLAVAFGDSVVNKMSVWSGQEGARRPNEALQWATIQWAHEAGYRTYDLEGLPRKVAEAVRDTGELPEAHRQSVSSYKLGFGGRVVVFPSAFEFVPGPLLRWAYGQVVGRVDRRRIKRLVQRMRVRNR